MMINELFSPETCANSDKAREREQAKCEKMSKLEHWEERLPTYYVGKWQDLAQVGDGGFALMHWFPILPPWQSYWGALKQSNIQGKHQTSDMALVTSRHWHLCRTPLDIWPRWRNGVYLKSFQ